MTQTWYQHSEQLEALLDHVLDLPEAQRQIFIDSSAVPTELKPHLVRLLKLTEQQNCLDQAIPIELIKDAPEGISHFENSGTQIGPYVLIKPLGEGGMARVWLAQRKDAAFDHPVALKLIKQGLSSEEIQTRFIQEQRILAKLQHAHISRMYDAGLSAEGTPYLVMEWVKNGTPLLRYCNQTHQSIQQRLQLLIKVCAAVSYAHQNLIVHRDLKPANILIDDQGEPKLLDFGIAKILHDEHELVTQTGLKLLTPGYAAPEQHRAEAVTTLTDVYALGVILFELLTSLRPPNANDTTPISLLSPSQALKKLAQTQDADAQNTLQSITTDRSTRFESLHKQLQGDLDVIVLKAIQEEPSRRYASAAALSDDLQRYLKQEPIHARKDSWRYRSLKFARRHVFGLSLSLLFALTLIGATLFSLHMANTAQKESLRATQSEQQAKLETKRAEVAKQFLVDIFQTSNNGLPRDRMPSVKDLLKDGAARVSRELSETPELKADMLLLLGKIHWDLGETTTGEELLKEALTLCNRIYTPKDEAWLACQTGANARIQSNAAANRAQLLEKAIALHRLQHPKNNLALANALLALGAAYGDLVNAEASIRNTREGLHRLNILLGPNHKRVVRAKLDLAYDLIEALRPKEAAPLLDSLAHEIKSTYGDESYEYARYLNTYAAYLRNSGRPAEAIPYARQSVKLADAIYIPPTKVNAKYYFSLGYLLFINKQNAEAIYWLSQAINVNKKDNSNTENIGAMFVLGQVYLEEKNFAAAEKTTNEALTLAYQAFPLGHDYQSATLFNLGRIKLKTQRYQEAHSYFKQAVTITINTPQKLYNYGSLLETDLLQNHNKALLLDSENAINLLQTYAPSEIYYAVLSSQIKYYRAAALNRAKRPQEVLGLLQDITADTYPWSESSNSETMAPKEMFPKIMHERGIARMALKDYPGAVKDLTLALTHAKERKLEAAEIDAIDQHLKQAQRQLNPDFPLGLNF